MFAKKMLPFLLVVMMAISVVGCKRIEPGHVGIKVDLYGKDKGVQSVTAVTGMNFYLPFMTDIYDYPGNVQTVVWTASHSEGKAENEEVTFNTKDSTIIAGDFSVSYELEKEKIPSFYVRFRNDDIKGFTHGFFRNQFRDAINEETVMYSTDEFQVSKEKILNATKDRLNKRMNVFGVNVISVGFTSAPRLPKNIQDAIDTKNRAIQDAIAIENQKRAAEAQAAKQRVQAEGNAAARIVEAEGTAKANAILQQSATAGAITLRRLDNEGRAIDKWDGHLPEYMAGGANAPVPFISVKPPQQ